MALYSYSDINRYRSILTFFCGILILYHQHFFCPWRPAFSSLGSWPLVITVVTDQSPLQDFCVADPSNGVMLSPTVFVNGFACKDPNMIQANGFYFGGLHLAGNVSNQVGSKVTPVNVLLEVGFVTSNPDNRLIMTVLSNGDVFAFPVGPIHYLRNVGYGNAIAIAALNSQNPGIITIANAVFGSNLDIAMDILAKAFQVEKSIAGQIQSKF
ncbi:hypothetical protein BT93_D1003 [Corymbia citriodora subsp. variegata]|nr:hypothetical protein BT93_D1003 [Corymbia citriodora subsp. variegata]